MPSSAPVDAIDVALFVAAALDAAGCEYFVGGSVASSLQGEPRATNDIDIVVAMPLFKVVTFARALGPDFELDQDMLRDAIVRGSSANMFYLPLVTKIDLFALGEAAYDEAEFSRRRRVRVRLTGEELWVKSPEDTVLRKLWWYQQGGAVSDKQWRDVVEVLRVSAPLDVAYLDRWAPQLTIADLLERARREAASPSER